MIWTCTGTGRGRDPHLVHQLPEGRDLHSARRNSDSNRYERGIVSDINRRGADYAPIESRSQTVLHEKIGNCA